MMAKILRKIRGLRLGLCCLLGAALVDRPVVAASASGAAGERALREALLELGESEAAGYPAALEKLTAAPRAQLLALLRDDLAEAPQIRRVTIRAIVALHARELLPELKTVAKQTEFWWVFAGLNTLVAGDEEGGRELAPVYAARLGNLMSAAAKLAVLNGLTSFHAGLSAGVFNELVDSESFELRIAAVRHWRATRDLLGEAERRRRLDKVLEVQPRQARVLAWREVPRLPASERAHLRKSLTKERCERESDPGAREACRKAEKSLGGRP